MPSSRFKVGALVTLLTVFSIPVSVQAQLHSQAPDSPASEAIATQAQAAQLLRQGAEQFQAGQARTALSAWHQALTLYQQVGDRQGEARALSNLGAASGALGDLRQAIAYYQQSLTLAQALKDAEGISYALGNLGFSYQSLGDYQQAIDYHQRDLALAQERQNRAAEQYALNNLGIAYKAQGNYDRAVALFQQSLAIAQEGGDRAGEANSIGNLGNVYAEQGSYPQALAAYGQTLTLMKDLKNRRGESIVLERLGNVYAALGNPEQAIAYYQRSLTVARSISDSSRIATVLGNLGIVARSQGNLEQAIDFLQQSLVLLRQLGDRNGEATALNSLGNAYSTSQNYEKAKDYYQQSLAIARDIGDVRGAGVALGNLGQTSDLLNRDAEAAEYLQQSLAIARQVGDRLMEGQALHNLGIVQFESGDRETAATSLESAIEIWESLRTGLSDDNQVSLFETQADTYRLLQKVLIELRRPHQALEVSERGRARAFIELMSTRLLHSSPESQSSAPPPSALTVEQMRQIGRTQNATLVEYSITDKTELSIWVIHPNGTIDFRQSPLSQVDTSLDQVAEQTRVAAALGRGGAVSDTALTTLVENTRSALGISTRGENSGSANLGSASPGSASPDSANPRRPSRQLRSLHQLLIEPIADLLPTDPTQRVIFIPQASLFLVPFAALQDAEGKFLIEQHTILTAPAIQVLQLTHQKRQQIAESIHLSSTPQIAPLIVGNPVMPDLGTPPVPLPDLPNAEQEARSIASLLQTEAIIGNQATESNIVRQMTRSRIIHLATHGLLNDFFELGSPGAIALTPTATADGFLTASEILNLSLNADLVVLSACNTGRGRITGDGVIGLSRSFMSAGAASVVVSLWAVPDAPTASLMTEFYHQLQQNPDKAQALRQAMIKTMQQYPSSRDWAAFTLMGEAD
ncbi:MAG TPA: CHAT domain-containing tetratricopeptide repeat protein [Coleofasciculaceae cyanobacterium]|jgi:CHAT domain-containing protein/tetratricopeptide (TPR) repeat protein